MEKKKANRDKVELHRRLAGTDDVKEVSRIINAAYSVETGKEDLVAGDWGQCD